MKTNTPAAIHEYSHSNMDEQRIKDLLRSNHVELVEKLDFRDTMLPDVLLTQKLLTRNDIDVMQSKKIKREMSKYFLLNILPCRGPDAFNKFMYGLIMTPEQAYIAENLDPILAAEIKEKLGRGPPAICTVRRGREKKDVLRVRHLYLIENIRMKNSDLLGHLYQEGLLTEYEQEKLETLESNDKMVSEYLLFMLPYKGPDHVDKFIKTLSSIDDAPLQAIAKTLQDDLEPPVDETDNSASLESIVSHLKTKGVSAFSSLTSVTRDVAEKAMKEDAYQLRRKKRGRAVIICNKYFVGNKVREGADNDLADLKTLFENLYFDVIPYENCSSEAMIKAVDDECEPGKHDNYDAFVMFILTHGTNGYVSGSDSKNPVKIDDVVKKIGRCESLKGKPKIFFIQACRVAEGSTPGPPGSDATDAAPSDDGMKETKELTNWSPLQNAERSEQQIADFKDIYIAYSTVPGFYSYRSEETGSWFVRFLIYVISTRAHVDDLESMIKRVNRLLESRPEKSEQIGQTVATGLSRKIYFFPNYSTE